MIKTDVDNRMVSFGALRYKRNLDQLEQNQHLRNIIDRYQPALICNFTSFKPWASLDNAPAQTCDLLLYAHCYWQSLQEIIDTIKLYSSPMIFLAINKYLLLDDGLDPDLDEDYNLAIRQVIESSLRDHHILEYKYHAQEAGDIGNFIVPDNRFFICKNNS